MKWNKLIPETVRNQLMGKEKGVYFLGNFKENEFYVCYVGRSETSLRRRLLEHSRNGRYKFFSYKIVQTKKSTFSEEDLAFNSFWGLDNKISPAIKGNGRLKIDNWEKQIKKITKNIDGGIKNGRK
jgi:hypothetical protein